VLPGATARVYEVLRPWINPETTINFAAHSLAGTPAWSTEVASRLEAVRAQYDPHGVFGVSP
jgi:hypothetical protein